MENNQNQFKKEVNNWRTKSEYVDLETGEILTKEQVVQNYIIVNTKKKAHVYKTTGTITFTNECRRTNQLKLF